MLKVATITAAAFLICANSGYVVGDNTHNEIDTRPNQIREVFHKVTDDPIIEIEKSTESHPTIFIVRTAKKNYAVKFACTCSIEKFAYFADLASNLKFGPKLHFVDKKIGMIVTDFISQDKITLQLIEDPTSCDSFYRKLARILLKIHNTQPTIQIKKVDIKNVLEEQFQFLKKNKKLSPNDIDLLESAKKIAMETKITVDDNTLCHCGLHMPESITYSNGKCFFINHAIISMFDACYDIATVLVFWCPTEKEEQIFLNHYFGNNIPPEKLRKIEIFKKIVMFGYVINSIMNCVDNCKIETTPTVSYFELASKYGYPISADTDKQKLEIAAVFIREILDREFRVDHFR
jgi:thiamine kinase-like enzyme